MLKQVGPRALQDAPAGPVPALARGLTAAAAALLLASAPAALPPPASAELSTITAQQATEMAKPLKQQKVNKGRIWALFVLGATALFGTTGKAGREAARPRSGLILLLLLFPQVSGFGGLDTPMPH